MRFPDDVYDTVLLNGVPADWTRVVSAVEEGTASSRVEGQDLLGSALTSPARVWELKYLAGYFYAHSSWVGCHA